MKIGQPKPSERKTQRSGLFVTNGNDEAKAAVREKAANIERKQRTTVFAVFLREFSIISSPLYFSLIECFPNI